MIFLNFSNYTRETVFQHRPSSFSLLENIVFWQGLPAELTFHNQLAISDHLRFVVRHMAEEKRRLQLMPQQMIMQEPELTSLRAEVSKAAAYNA